MSIDDIRTPEDILSFLDENIQYGYVDINGEKHINDLKGFRSLYRTSSLEDTLSTGVGTCIEQVNLMHVLLNKLNIPNRMFCTRVYEDNNFNNPNAEEHMHCFILYYMNGKVYQLEHPDQDNKGIYEYNSESEAIAETNKRYIKMSGGVYRPVTEFFDVKPGLTFKEFNDHINDLDVKKLNQVLDNPVNKTSEFDRTINELVPYCKEIMDEDYIDAKEGWSRKMDLLEAVEIIYRFLLTVDNTMATDFLNVMRSTDENGEPYIKLLPRKDNPNGISEYIYGEGKAVVYYDNTPNDVFVLFHEVLHKMNGFAIKIDDDLPRLTIAKDYYGEVETILSEYLIGQYMVNNNIITENDFNIRCAFREDEVKRQATTVLIENELIKMRSKNISITDENIEVQALEHEPDSIERDVLILENVDRRRRFQILHDGRIGTVKDKRYILAHIGVNKILKRGNAIKEFFELCKDLRNPYVGREELEYRINNGFASSQIFN